MEETTWTDPRYAGLVETWDQMRQNRARRGPAAPCPSCLHGLGSIVMVDLVTKKPTVIPCPRCSHT